MPVSPQRRAEQEVAKQQSDGRSTAGSGKAKRKPKPTSKAKNRKKKIEKRYSSAREEAQLAGVIPTTPDGAVHDERVAPSAQGTQPMPALIAEAIRKGWKVPEGLKPQLVDEMVAIILDPDMSAKVKVGAFNALRTADRSQWEQDNPVDAGKAKGGTTNVGLSLQANTLAVQVIRDALQNDEGRGISAIAPSGIPSGIGNSRFDGQVESCAASTTDQSDFSQRLALPEQSDINYSTLPTRKGNSERSDGVD